MNTPETIEVTLDSIAQGGDAVGRVDGLVIFAAGGLPGERVSVRISERHPSYARGTIDHVIEPSPDRVEPRVAGDGHAAWQHIAYPAQLRFKETILREQLAKLAGLADPPLAPIIAAPQTWGYRNSGRLHVAGGKIGYYAAGSREVIDLTEDPLLLPVLNEALAGLHAVGASDLLSGVTLRASSAYGYAIAALHPARTADVDDLEQLALSWQSRVPAVAGVVIDHRRTARQPDDERAAVTIRDELDGVVFDLSVESFFQVNVPQAERMVTLVREQLDLSHTDRLLDAYSGAGTFALPLAADVAEVVAVEENAAAVVDGRRSARLNDIENVRFIQSPVERVLIGLEGSFAAAVLDPPRRGCHPAVIDALAEVAPGRIAYISCHPGILARDLGPILAAGYRLDLIQPIDLFPQTPHIECVVILSAIA